MLATFGRGFYVLDDLAPLRAADDSVLAAEGHLFATRTAPMYVPSSPMGGEGAAGQGARFYVAPNPPFGAVFTYHLKDGYKSRSEARHAREKETAGKGGDTFYPSWDSLRAEVREEPPTMVLTVRGAGGELVRRLTGPVGEGFHRVAWDFTYPASTPAELAAPKPDRYDSRPTGPRVAPGTYEVSLAKRIDGVETPLGEPQSFRCEPVGESALPPGDRAQVLAFEQRTARLQRAVMGAVRASGELGQRTKLLRVALDDTPAAPPELARELLAIQARLRDLDQSLRGDVAVQRYQEPTPPSLLARLGGVIDGHWASTSAPTQTQRRAVDIVSQAFTGVLAQLQGIARDLESLETRAEAAGAPWTPGRLPVWQPE